MTSDARSPTDASLSATPARLPPRAPGDREGAVAFDEVLRAYLETYAKRRVRRGGTAAFESFELDALAGLVISRLGRNLASESRLIAVVDSLEEATRGVLEGGFAHEPALDIAGLAWAEAYGVLALPDPAVEHLEWVLEMGGASGTITGALTAAWRSLFLASAMGQLNWRWREQARSELARRTDYLRDKLLALLAASKARPISGADLRVALVTAELTALHPVLADVAEPFMQHVLKWARPAQLPSSQLCQFALVAAAAGERERGRLALEGLLRERWNPDSGLVRSAAGAHFNSDSSPWIPLALVAFGAAVVPPPPARVSPLPSPPSRWAWRRR